MRPIETITADCPWCGASLETDVDLTAGNRSYVEDCQICCAPIVLTIEIEPAFEPGFRITLAREGE